MATSFFGSTCINHNPEQDESIHSNLFWCSVCESVLCEACWGSQAPHNPNNRMVRKKHEKTKLALAEMINAILLPDTDIHVHEKRHIDNIATKWFGVMDDSTTGKSRFHDFQRFTRLANGSDMDPANQYPCLTTFVGETGAGKSTLINAMIRTISSHSSRRNSEVTPVIGVQIDSPTSGDVHLFSDPSTYHEKRPIYYADCEGMNGGKNAPLSTKFINKLHKKGQKAQFPKAKVNDITWVDAKDKGKSRDLIVERLYPRILFTFSDVVVLVSRNFRAIQHHLEQLIKWADKVFQKSINQPILPYAIIVVNALEDANVGSGTDWWDIHSVTSRQLKKYEFILDPYSNQGGLLPRLAMQWRGRGKTIRSFEDLLYCYYSGFKIICIPSANQPPQLIHDQYTKLYDEIRLASKKSEEKREVLGMLMSSDDLEKYLRSAFEHFSENSTEPFNFLDSAIRNCPIAATFADHIIKVAILVMKMSPSQSGTEIFKKLAPLIASSIFLSATRKRLPWRADSECIFNHYKVFCTTAQESFYTKHWPCEELNKRRVRCVNVSSGHEKGHQGPDGKLFKTGEFVSAFNSHKEEQTSDFLEDIKAHLKNLVELKVERLTELNGNEDVDEEREVSDIHLRQTLMKYTRYWSRRSKHDDHEPLASHTTCFSCLMSVPIHTLCCGHVICERCVLSYSPKTTPNHLRRVDFCPLCCNINNPWPSAWEIIIKPPTAGLRILSLDGGGIRSIVQLVILKELERVIDLNIPIQDFFDLIIGTSGGGIVAFGLGIKQLTVEQCIQTFKQVSKEAFTKRKAVGWVGIGKIVEAQHHSIYKTETLINALKTTFGHEPLFGAKASPGRQLSTKVGVTATSSSHAAYLLANYNRSEPDSPQYAFFRGEDKYSELKAWEALRATSAAPMYFKSFYHAASTHTFNDGGIRFNNPVTLANEERKIIWPELKDHDPDILLSIGTAYDSSSTTRREDPGPKPQTGIKGFARKLLKIAVDIIQDEINCQQTWIKFLEGLAIQEGDTERNQKYFRLNPDFKGSRRPIPKLDDVNDIDWLETYTARHLIHSKDLHAVAATLIASLFYFEVKHIEGDMEAGPVTIDGT
ncbi:FabD/lysophospholipase-like protein [Wilcoxina mikolae CBS 423.85]|nr:FabD/lysophospholipase-like protein [Wilcoxina mikolae CBS 423.85]